MTNFQINYTHPWLLLLIPLAVILTLIPYFRMNKKYRCTRNRVTSIVLHLIAMVLGINLLAGITFSYEVPNEGNQVIILVDVTDSNITTRSEKDEFVLTVLSLCEEDCEVGIVKFGFDQKYAVEFTQDSEAAYEQYLLSEDPDTTATNLSGALKYASSLFTNKETGKIVVISDGIETDGTAVSVIKGIAAEGTKVDTMCFPNPEEDEAQITNVTIPEQKFDSGDMVGMEVTVQHNLGPGEHKAYLTLYGNGQVVQTMPISLTKDSQVFPVAVGIEGYGLHEIRFEISIDGDTEKQNNSYTTYIHLQKFENILLIERYENESEKLQAMLADEYKVTAISVEEDAAQIPADLYTMAQYEQIILVNIAYSDMPAGFEELLNHYVYELGGGLFTVGGENEMVNGQLVPHAYNRNDIKESTFYKQMLPVDVEDFAPPIAVMILVDASASMSGGVLDMAKQGAESCLDTLTDRDYCGVISFQARSSEELEVLPVSHRETILEAIRNIGNEEGSHGGTIFADAIMKAGQALSVIEGVERKHIIIVTDGNPGDSLEIYGEYIKDNLEKGITLSVITVGNYDASLNEKMDQTAELGGGKHTHVPKDQMENIPTLMQQELAMEAVAEIKYGEEFTPKIGDLTPVVDDIDQSLMPVLTGYYGTRAKESALVPLKGQYVPIYAQWKYGKGSVGSFMCDLNGNWSGAFMEDETGKTIIMNIVENLFPMEDVRSDDLKYAFKVDNYTTQLNIHGVAENNTIRVQVVPFSEALKQQVTGSIPVLEAEDNRRFTFVLKNTGIYKIIIQQIDESGNVIHEVSTHQAFSYSQEYNAFPDREPLGQELMTLLAADGNGVVLEDPVQVYASFAKTLKRIIDPRIVFLILVIVLVLLDIAVRKFKFKWPHELIREYKQKKADQS